MVEPRYREQLSFNKFSNGVGVDRIMSIIKHGVEDLNIKGLPKFADYFKEIGLGDQDIILFIICLKNYVNKNYMSENGEPQICWFSDNDLMHIDNKNLSNLIGIISYWYWGFFKEFVPLHLNAIFPNEIDKEKKSKLEKKISENTFNIFNRAAFCPNTFINV